MSCVAMGATCVYVGLQADIPLDTASILSNDYTRFMYVFVTSHWLHIPLDTASISPNNSSNCMLIGCFIFLGLITFVIWLMMKFITK